MERDRLQGPLPADLDGVQHGSPHGSAIPDSGLGVLYGPRCSVGRCHVVSGLQCPLGQLHVRSQRLQAHLSTECKSKFSFLSILGLKIGEDKCSCHVVFFQAREKKNVLSQKIILRLNKAGLS